MEKVKTLADLKKIQQEQLKAQQAREGDVPRVIVGMGTCGIAAGARDVLLALMEEVDTRNLQVNISQTGCIGMCEHEPLIDIQLDKDRVTYGKVTPEMVKRIVSEHIVNGKVVNEAALARLTEED